MRINSHGYKFHSFSNALHEVLKLSEELTNMIYTSYQTRITEIDGYNAEEYVSKLYGRHSRDVRKQNLRNRSDMWLGVSIRSHGAGIFW